MPDRFRSLVATVVGVGTDSCSSATYATGRSKNTAGGAIMEPPMANRRVVSVIDRDGIVHYAHIEPKAVAREAGWTSRRSRGSSND